jgi:cytochrome c-type biogenesis protein CcmE
MKARARRGLAIAGGLAALGVASALVLNAFSGNLVFFFSPSQVAANEAPRERSFRVGGLVEEGSIRRQPGGLTVHFVVTDLAKTVPVVYTGLLPDLFVEGKGVVAQGRLGSDGVFRAEQVLAKHDENYMAPEAAQALTDARKRVVPAGPPLQGAPGPAGPDRSVGSPHAARNPHLAPSPLPEGEGAEHRASTPRLAQERNPKAWATSGGLQ